ncbi:EPIDERMAL PATTERNING FACTOR 1 protein [Nymphaea thermarum]|nr:EPIDERMAL PATTERNING FACTOR 1 protein [Nymphaea thermarum]
MAAKSLLPIKPLILVLILLFVLQSASAARNIDRHHHRHRSHHQPAARPRTAIKRLSLLRPEYLTEGAQGRHGRPRVAADTLQVAGSSLPDCSHACGSCSPCRRVMVSFVCATLEEAETCPMAYKCMCNSKSYPVP